MLVEHYNGAFPLWLAPVQVLLVPITEQQIEYARDVEKRLTREGVRVSLDDRAEKMQAKIRDAQLEKIPYVLVMGRREAESKTISVRDRNEGDLGAMTVEEFLEKTKEARNLAAAQEIF
jgi:threonyl-tRNA synthetase